MRYARVAVVILSLAATLLMAGCTQAAPVPTPAKPTAAATVPTKIAEPTKAAATSAAPANAPQPTAAPTKKVDYPTKGKTVTLIVPYAAGGVADLASRILASAMEQDLGVPFEVSNKVGAGGQVALTAIATSKPDGYTLCTAAVPASNITYLDKERKAVYDAKSFTQVAGFALDPVIVITASNGPYKTAKDLADAAKAAPAKIKLGTSGLMTNSHVAGLLFQKAAGASFAFVHFDGNAPGTTALLGGHIDGNIGPGGSFGSPFQSGTVRAVGIMAKESSKFYPGVPTMQSQGYAVSTSTQYGFIAPAGTPKEIVDILADSVKRAMARDDFKKKADEMLLPQYYMSPTDYSAYWLQNDQDIRPIMEATKAE